MKRRRGLFLPAIAGLAMLIMISVLLVASFGSSTRRLLTRAEKRSLCRQAAISAIEEMRTTFEGELTLIDSDDWAPWWRALLPPATGSHGPLSPVGAPATADAFAGYGVQLADLEVRCLDRRTGHHIKAQGLLSIVARARWVGDGGTVAIRREERYRYYVDTQFQGLPDPPPVWDDDDDDDAVVVWDNDPTVKENHRLYFFPLCTQERGGES